MLLVGTGSKHCLDHVSVKGKRRGEEGERAKVDQSVVL